MIFHLFKKKKKSESINVQEINAWITKTLEKKNIGLKVGILKREINSKKTKIQELLQELEEADFKDETVIPERAKSIFKGNKNSYIQKVNLFLDTISPPEDVSSLEEFLEETSTSLEKLAEDTNKNFFIIKEFTEDEIRAVANKLKELDKLISEARSTIEKTSLSKFKDLRKLLNEYHESNVKLEETKKALEQVLEKKAEAFERKKKIESKIATLKKSSQEDDYSELKSKREGLEEEIKQTEYAVINLFSSISSILKKYSKKKRNKTSKDYSDNAVEGLLKDEDIKIIKVLEDVEKVKSTLDIKDSKLKKLESDMKAITKKGLEKLRNILISLKKEIQELDIRLKNHPYKLNLKEQEGKINIIDENIKEIEQEEQQVEEVLERTNPRLIKQKMKALIKEIDEYTDLI